MIVEKDRCADGGFQRGVRERPYGSEGFPARMADFNGAFANAPYGSEAMPFPDSGGERSSVYRI